MKIKKLGISMSDRILSLALAGTLVGSVNAMVANGETVKYNSSRASSSNELFLGAYYDEDVKKNKNAVMNSVSQNGNKEKTFSKVKSSLVPRKLDK